MDVDQVAQGSFQPASQPPRQPTLGHSFQRASSLPASLEPDNRSVGYVYDTRMLLHDSTSDHPESPARIVEIYTKIQDNNCLKYMRKIPIRPVKKAEVLLIHSEDHWDKVESIRHMTLQEINDAEMYYQHLSLYVCPSTPLAAQLSCGGVIECALAVAKGELKKSFAIVRPPGHHAEPEEHQGFCFFNNVAVAARVVQQMSPIKRILILDWDVHHGNGTQRAFWDDPDVLYISIHRYDGGQFYPCGPFGALDSCGEGPGLGRSVNIPWPEGGMGDADYIHSFHKIVMPIAMEFAPELVIISAGFDAAAGDELGECLVSPAGYAHMTYMLAGLAGGRLVVALEGGYNVESISNSAVEVARTLVGEAPPEMKPMEASEISTETVWQVAMQQSKFWKSVDPKACEPSADPAVAVPIPELLKAYRQEFMYQEHNMLQVPLMDEELDERFNAQVMCSDDVMDQNTVVLFVHQFGNIRVELEGAMTCNMDVEYSYLLDVTKDLVRWIREQKYGLVEVNTYPRPPTIRDPARSMSALGRDVLTYLWDNYIQLSNATSIVLVGHGLGCEAIMELMASRTQNIMKKVKAVAQVVGNATLPQVPKGADELRAWFIHHSLVVVPETHRIYAEGRVLKKHGRVVKYSLVILAVFPVPALTEKWADEERPTKLLSCALPDIQQFIKAQLEAVGIKENGIA